jgi:ParB-like chromosome segregation protein Spo0J|tara:strand:- start:72 stop:557 length:486 start_codon:yes stop_codon:yes gene_type:complete
MQIEIVDINKIVPYINNPRKNTNIDKVASSIKEFGFQQPIVVDKNYTIIVGHSRFEAAKKLDLKEVPVQIADLTENQSKAYRIADNKVAQDNYWDFEKLQIELDSILENNYELINTGFDSDELDNLLNKNSKTDDNSKDSEINESDLKGSKQCPSCGYEFD